MQSSEDVVTREGHTRSRGEQKGRRARLELLRGGLKLLRRSRLELLGRGRLVLFRSRRLELLGMGRLELLLRGRLVLLRRRMPGWRLREGCGCGEGEGRRLVGECGGGLEGGRALEGRMVLQQRVGRCTVRSWGLEQRVCEASMAPGSS